MHKRLSQLAAAVLLFASVGIQPASAAAPHYDTICVDTGGPTDPVHVGCYATITTALQHAKDGDVIEIYPGTYAENFLIQRSITLRGVPGDSLVEYPVVLTHGEDTYLDRMYWSIITIPTLANAEQTTVTIENLRITGGLGGSTGNGGGIRHGEGSLYLMNVVIDANHAKVDGGGVYSSGHLEVQDSLVTDNVAEMEGGGIYTDGTLVVENSQVTSNTADTAGGGIYGGRDAKIILSGTDVSHNKAEREGGGIYAVDLEATESTISSNMVTTSPPGTGGGVMVTSLVFDPAWGGGMADETLHVEGGSAILERTTIANNYAAGDGGGLAMHGGTLTLKNVTLSGNYAGGTGGGLQLARAAPYGGQYLHFDEMGEYLDVRLTMVHTTIADNSADLGGGIAGTFDESWPSFIIGNLLAYNAGLNCDPPMPEGGGVITGDNISDDGSCGFEASDFGSSDNTDPMLNPLALNAPGSVMTHALQNGSPALDRYALCLVPVDARGVEREEYHCDIGAYEGHEPAKPWPEDPRAFRATALLASTCRFGPSTAYGAAAYLAAGDVHQVSGRNEAGTWLKLENCWVYTPLLQVDGDINFLAVVPAPPLPTPTQKPVCKPTLSEHACRAGGWPWNYDLHKCICP